MGTYSVNTMTDTDFIYDLSFRLNKKIAELESERMDLRIALRFVEGMATGTEEASASEMKRTLDTIRNRVELVLGKLP